MKLYTYFCVLFLSVSILGCSKFVEIDPPKNSLVDKTAYQNNAIATAVMTGVFIDLAVNTDLATGGPFGFGGLSGMLTDEISTTVTTPNYVQFYTNSITSDNSALKSIWTRAYNTIYRSNAVIEGVTESDALSVAVKDQLIGEARFIRAFMLFNLVNIYGAVPLPLSTDYQTNTTLPRSPVAEVYSQILSDLKAAQSLLPADYLSATNSTTTDRVRPNKYAATALLARVQLYLGDWTNAEAEATAVINQSGTYRLDKDLNKTFLVASTEAIWQLGLGPNGSGLNTWDGYYYIALKNSYFLSDRQTSTLAGDKRFTNWTSSVMISTATKYHPFKYKVMQPSANSVPTEHTMVFRLAEQYLIRAEARAMLGRITGTGGANEDLTAVRARVDLGGVNPATLAAFMPLLEKERQMELFTEWGHRWFDLKRWKGFSNSQITRADEVMPLILSEKGGVWKSQSIYWPIPESEVLVNPKLN